MVHSSRKGGTWSGACENPKKGWVPVSQTDAWLKRALAENKVAKLTRPVRYQWVQSRTVSADQPSVL